MKFGLFVSALSLAACGLASCGPTEPEQPAAQIPTDPVVVTASGSVEGFVEADAAKFLGIPFAAPPVGDLRWRPPEKPTPWTTARDAKAFGPPCAQVYLLGPFAGPANNNEDCLFLNVFAPKDAVDPASKLPVLVWIYGGGYVNGNSADYDGSKLAVDGRMIVVTLNYRHNLMGFLAHPALDKEGHPFGNYAFLDQQLALKWVQENIAAFGGDAGNVTLGGQSAGGSSTGVHLTSPLSKGLFHKAIISSAGSYLIAAPLDVAEKMGVEFAKAAGCGEGADEATAACLRALRAEEVLKHAGTAKGNSAFIHSRAIRDGQIVLDGAAPLFADGKFQQMPMMIGTVRDEGQFFLGVDLFLTGQPWKQFTHDDVSNYAKATFTSGYPAGTVDKALAQYPVANYATAQLRFGAIQSDVFVCRAQRAIKLLADKTPIYAYEFRDRTAPSYFPAAPGFEPGAYHTAEIQYVFSGYHGGPDGISHELSAEQKALSDRIVQAWANFARTGNPNGEGNEPWPAYTKQTPVYAAQDISGPATISEQEFSADHQCDFWQAVLP